MKQLESIIHEKNTLTVLVETKEDNGENKGFVSYFLNGHEVVEWTSLNLFHQNLFTVLANELCRCMTVPKWSY